MTPDGRFLFWVDSQCISCTAQLWILDVTTGGTFPLREWRYFPGLLSHPTEVKAFARSAAGFVTVGATTEVDTPLAPCNGVDDLRSLTEDGRRALMWCPSATSSLRVIDLENGTAYPVPSDASSLSPSLSPDGNEVIDVVPTVSPGDGRLTLRRWDVASGAMLAANVFRSNTSAYRSIFDPRHDQIVLIGFDIRAFDRATLTEVASFSPPSVQFDDGFIIDPDRPRMYAIGRDIFGPSVRLYEIDTRTLSPVRTAQIGYTRAMVLAPLPKSPRALTAAVTGQSVRLSWQGAPAGPTATHYEVEAGSATGLANLARLRTGAGETQLVVDGVPPGAYFVRVRGVNFSGSGAVSDEIVVTVRQ